MGHRQGRRNTGGRSSRACWMSPATSALVVTKGVGSDIENNIVRAVGRTRRHARGDIVQVKGVTHFPGYDVIRAGSIAADANRPDELSLRIVERQSTAEDIHTADLFTDHEIVLLAVVL